jgi:hypothetical protein
MKVKHIKTGNIYKIVGKALNTTTGQKEQEMVLYQNQNGMLFCKEINEFKEKFTEVNNE